VGTQRWIVSDGKTVAEINRRLNCAAQTISEPAEALRLLLQSSSSLALLPCTCADHAIVATIRRSGVLPAHSGDAASTIQHQREPRQVATGFLGLVDELVWEEEEAGPKPAWWRKLID
jgi:hypothetical protein